MLELPCDLCFLGELVFGESFATQLGAQRLDRDLATNDGIVRRVDAADPAPIDLAQMLEAPNVVRGGSPTASRS